MKCVCPHCGHVGAYSSDPPPHEGYWINGEGRERLAKFMARYSAQVTAGKRTWKELEVYPLTDWLNANATYALRCNAPDGCGHLFKPEEAK